MHHSWVTRLLLQMGLGDNMVFEQVEVAVTLPVWGCWSMNAAKPTKLSKKLAINLQRHHQSRSCQAPSNTSARYLYETVEKILIPHDPMMHHQPFIIWLLKDPVCTSSVQIPFTSCSALARNLANSKPEHVSCQTYKGRGLYGFETGILT